MKKIAFLSILILTFLLSCEKETFLSVDQTSINVLDAGGSSTVSLTANKPWTASSNQSWCKVSPSSGEEATSSRITISCDPNTTHDARNATITFTCAELTKQVSITQTMNNGLMVTQTSYELTKAAQQINIDVKANVKFSVEVDSGCKDWVKYNTTKGLTTSTVVLDIAENKTYDSREGKVTIKQDGGSLSSTITIKQSQLDGLFLTTSEYNLSNEKHTLTVEVSTNVEFDVKPEADWVKYVQTKGLSTKQIVLEVAENDTYDQRETKVNVKQKNGDLSGTITIKQDEKYGILVSQSEYNLTNEAQTIEVEVKYNVDFEVSIPDGCKDWIKQVSTKGLSTKNYTFSIAKNETYDNREGSITFKQKKGSLSGTIAVKQAQTDCIIPEKSEYIISYEEQQLIIKVASNIEYEVYIDEDCRSWLSRVQTKGLTEETITFQVTKNEGDERSGKITFKSATIQETVLVQQQAGIVVFDDELFESYCISNFDKNGDGEISVAEARVVTRIVCASKQIQSLSGIEFFTELTHLNCSNNQLTSLNLSHNIALDSLACSKNQLTSLDLSHNTALTCLSCQSNQLTNLDVRHNTALTYLECRYNRLTSLDVSHNTALTWLSCFGNCLTSLDVSHNTALTDLSCSNNQLTSLDVSHNTALTDLYCYSNQLTSLDVSLNTALAILACQSNQLTYLDVSHNTALTDLSCSNNLLTSLDISYNSALTNLSCDSNHLTYLDVSHNTALTRLACASNQLAYLDVSHNTALEYLLCQSNQLSNLDVSYNTTLTGLYCFNNRLTSLDVSHNTALACLECYSNQLTSLDVSHNTSLYYLDCKNNPYLTEIWLKTGQTIQDFQYDTDLATVKYK